MKNNHKNTNFTTKTIKKSSFGCHFPTLQTIVIPFLTGYHSKKTNLKGLKPSKTTIFTPKSPILDHVFTKYSPSHQPKLSIHQTWHSSYQIANLPQEAKS